MVWPFPPNLVPINENNAVFDRDRKGLPIAPRPLQRREVVRQELNLAEKGFHVGVSSNVAVVSANAARRRSPFRPYPSPQGAMIIAEFVTPIL